MIWTIYKHPADYPGKYVARLFDSRFGQPHPTGSLIVMADLEALRDVLQFEMGLVKLMRSEEDHPHIVESWL